MEALRSLEGPAQGPGGALYDLYQAGLLRQLESGGFGWRCQLYKRLLLEPRPGKT